ncbi:endonuclease/exonuclease/phosphatase family protein [Bacillus massiliigorillae]|uniref:endonuclease/exonuclease/phosphatase family protein n=1 Tax=Bacillus massiliigorillae TaxID=1243664 RepID=UPI00039A3741|nr:endonuclease/exonuclease/phosphatase family protein [Bacillus massiliigorillae]
MKILSWNIRQGGTNGRYKPISTTLVEYNADVIVLSEFWEGEKGDFIKKQLTEAGYIYQVTHQAPFKVNSVFVASKIACEDITNMDEYAVPYERWTEFYFPESDFTLLGVHIPNHNCKLHDKEVFWEEMNTYAKNNLQKNGLIIGDFNTVLQEDSQDKPLSCTKYLSQLADTGWMDCWRFKHENATEFSYFNTEGKGFRLDDAFITPSLQNKVVSCELSHKEREEKLSDHSILLVELDI